MKCVNCNTDLENPKDAVCSPQCLEGAIAYHNNVEKFGYKKANLIWAKEYGNNGKELSSGNGTARKGKLSSRKRKAAKGKRQSRTKKVS